jgi:hypothetical protein
MLLWAVSANGNTSGLQPEIESSILSRSTKFLALLSLMVEVRFCSPGV